MRIDRHFIEGKQIIHRNIASYSSMRITFVTKRMFSVLIIILFVYYHRHTFHSLINFKTEQKMIWTELMETFCDNVQRQVENEEFHPVKSYSRIKPNVSDVNRRQSREIPYFYSQWRSHPVLKRRLIPCDHQLFMNLLSLIDQLCRLNSIDFFMSDGTLLGSYIQHDILPWDDDVDLLIGRKFRSLFQQIITEESSKSISLISVDRQGENYDKVFFPWSPKAGEELWSYPFVDIIYYDENATHLWKSKTTSVFNEHRAVPKSQIFPTVWRPLGQIWLPVNFFFQEENSLKSFFLGASTAFGNLRSSWMDDNRSRILHSFLFS